jgi:hypothetical protein
MTMGATAELGLRLFNGDEKKEKIACGEVRGREKIAVGEVDGQEKMRDRDYAPHTTEKNFGLLYLKNTIV